MTLSFTSGDFPGNNHGRHWGRIESPAAMKNYCCYIVQTWRLPLAEGGQDRIQLSNKGKWTGKPLAYLSIALVFGGGQGLPCLWVVDYTWMVFDIGSVCISTGCPDKNGSLPYLGNRLWHSFEKKKLFNY